MSGAVRELVTVSVQSATAAEACLHLPFMVGGHRFAIPYSEVARVTLPDGITTLGRYANLPSCVVGVTAADSEMLTVVDVGLLYGSAAIHRNMKTRLIVMTDGPMKGFALLVTRVLDMAPLSGIRQGNDIRITGAEELGTAMASLKKSNGELK